MDNAIGSAMVSSSRPMGIVPILFSFKLLIAFFLLTTVMQFIL